MKNFKIIQCQFSNVNSNRLLLRTKSIIIFLIAMQNFICSTYAQEHKIAVLPFIDSSDRSLISSLLAKKYTNFVEEGLPEIIMTRLTGSKILTVVETPKNYEELIRQLAPLNDDNSTITKTNLDLTYVITGNFMKFNSNMARIDARVVRVKNKEAIISETVQGYYKEKENLADTLAFRILNKLRYRRIIYKEEFSENLLEWYVNEKEFDEVTDPTDNSIKFKITGQISFENSSNSRIANRFGILAIYVNGDRIVTISPNNKLGLIPVLQRFNSDKFSYNFYINLIEMYTKSEYIVAFVKFSITIEKVSRIN